MEIRIIESTRPSREFLKNHTAYPLRWQSCALNLANLISARTRTTAMIFAVLPLIYGFPICCRRMRLDSSEDDRSRSTKTAFTIL